MLWRYLNSSVKTRGLGSSFCDPNLSQPTQDLDIGTGLLLDPNLKPKLRKNTFENNGNFLSKQVDFLKKVDKLVQL